MKQIIFLLLISHFSFSQLVPSFHAVHHKKIYSGLGDASGNPAESCKAILDNNAGAVDVVYWINLPTVGATQCYCLMDSDYDGGGWILAMKATRGTTFSYSANYWTSVNTLNPSEVNRDDGDAKFHSMNYFQAKDAMALFPDFPNIGAESGSIDNLSMWSWLENDFYI